jgi:hypothetical protein
MRLLSFIDGADGYTAMLEAAGDTDANAIRLAADAVARGSAEEVDEGRGLYTTESGPLEASWSPAGPKLEFTIGDGAVTLYGVAGSGSHGEEPFSGPGVAWELPDSGYSALRTAWAITAQSDLLVLIAIRPEDSRDHGEELVGAARIMAREEPYGYAEPLLSTEYDEAGTHTRATLELWAEGAERAERGGGLRVCGGGLSTEAGRLEAARFEWTIGGERAVGGYEILTT